MQVLLSEALIATSSTNRIPARYFSCIYTVSLHMLDMPLENGLLLVRVLSLGLLLWRSKLS